MQLTVPDLKTLCPRMSRIFESVVRNFMLSLRSDSSKAYHAR